VEIHVDSGAPNFRTWRLEKEQDLLLLQRARHSVNVSEVTRSALTEISAFWW
jgi:hypothetical protein